jgi:predicted DNA-binding protein (UPF0251 family)/predicted Fe-Mo cluster-binding NifX family protein
MPRPRKCRNVSAAPDITYFKPRGVPLRELAEVYLPLDGFEAIRLVDYNGLNHEAAASQMKVSRQTLGRILASARQIIAKALVQGLALRIHGGEYQLTQELIDADLYEKQYVGDDGNGGRNSVAPNPLHKESKVMSKIAVSCEGPTLDDAVDPRFGRAAGFMVVDTDTMEFEYLDNGASQARAQGAGIQAAETVAQSGAGAVLTGYVGPKAFQALAAAGVRIAQDLDNMTVRAAVEKFKTGEVVWAELEQAKGMGK